MVVKGFPGNDSELLRQLVLAFQGPPPPSLGLTELYVDLINAVENFSSGSGLVPPAGDIGGIITDPIVVGIQGTPVSATPPSTGELLQFNGTDYIPEPITSILSADGLTTRTLTVDFPGPVQESVTVVAQQNVVYADALGCDNTGAVECTALLNEVLSANSPYDDLGIPGTGVIQTSVTKNPLGGGGNTFTETPITIKFGVGTYKINESVQLQPLQPFQRLEGEGSGATILMDYIGAPSGGGLTNLNNYGILFENPNGYPFDGGPIIGATDGIVGIDLLWNGGGLFDLTLDGRNSGGCSAVCFTSGNGWRMERVIIKNYTFASSTALGVGPGPYWTEKFKFQFVSINNARAATWVGKNTGSSESKSHGELDIYVMAGPGQEGLVVQGGAWLYGSTIRLNGNMAVGTAVGGSKPAIALADAFTLVENCDFQVFMETNANAIISGGAFIADTGTVKPTTITLDTANGAAIENCTGYLVWLAFDGVNTATTTSGSWGPTNGFTFTGYSLGDTTIGQGWLQGGSLLTYESSDSSIHITNPGGAGTFNFKNNAPGLLGYNAVAGTHTFAVPSASTMTQLTSPSTIPVTFTAPNSGSVLVELTGVVKANSATDSIYWGLYNVTTAALTADSGCVLNAAADTGYHLVSLTLPVTGLTAGTSYTLEWAACGTSVSDTAVSTLNTGSSPSGVSAPACMKVWSG